MELQQLSCCGIFELCNIGDVIYDDGDDEWNAATNTWEPPEKLTQRQRLAAAKREIRAELNGIDPRGRLVFATTTPDMRLAAQALRGLRFRMVKRFRNGNSGNRVTVWMKLVR